jgi:glutamyl-tRNA reductase
MPLFAFGINYRSAPIEVRERVAFPADTHRSAIASVRDASAASEVMLISTCNRTEIYLRADDDTSVVRATQWLAATPGARDLHLDTHLYRLANAEVPRHAFRVASGLDSMILGEPQILGQVKQAVKLAAESHTLGGGLDRLFQETFKVAKEVRTQTDIGTTSISMTAAAVKLAAQLFGDLRDIKLLLVGAGEMIELAATHFAAAQPKEIVVANRTLERGRELAERFHAGNTIASAITLQQLPERVHEFDVIVTSTAASLPIIGKGMIERALKLRRRKPIFIVDLAVPRDVEAEVAELDDIFLYTLDSLGRVIEQNLQKREAAVLAADKIIDVRVTEFMQWLAGRGAVPIIQQLRSQADQYREAELARAKKLLAKGEEPNKVLEALALGLTNKFLHRPLAALNGANDGEREALSAAIEKLYPPQTDE